MIKLIDVHKAFGPKKVLEGFSLEVEEGETMVLIGYSGTGKSVAIKHIVGLLEPDSGTVEVDGLEVPRLSRRELYKLRARSEEHTSELQSHSDLVCRLLLEKKKKKQKPEQRHKK